MFSTYGQIAIEIFSLTNFMCHVNLLELITLQVVVSETDISYRIRQGDVCFLSVIQFHGKHVSVNVFMFKRKVRIPLLLFHMTHDYLTGFYADFL
jgi:hypothetical protein